VWPLWIGFLFIPFSWVEELCPGVPYSDMEAHVNMRRGVTDGLDREIVVTIQLVLNLVNSFIGMFLRVGEFIGNQEVLNVQLVSPGI